MEQLNGHYLGGWTDIEVFDGQVYLSRMSSLLQLRGVVPAEALLWRCGELDYQPIGDGFLAAEVRQADPIDVDAAAISIDALLEADGVLWAAGQRVADGQEYAAVWAFDGTSWVLRGQLAVHDHDDWDARGTWRQRLVRGMAIGDDGLHLAGDIGILTLRGSLLSAEGPGDPPGQDTQAAWDRQGYGPPAIAGGMLVVPNAAGVYAYRLEAGGSWRWTQRRTDGLGLAQAICRWDGELIALRPGRVMIAEPPSESMVARWDETAEVSWLPVRGYDRLLRFGCSRVEIGGETEGRVAWAYAGCGWMDAIEFPYAMLAARYRDGLVGVGFLPPQGVGSVTPGQGTTWTPSPLEAGGWPQGHSGSSGMGAADPPVVIQCVQDLRVTSITSEWAAEDVDPPQVDEIVSEWSDGTGAADPTIESITSEWSDGAGAGDPEIESIESQWEAGWHQVAPTIESITSEWCDGSEEASGEILSVRSEWAADHAPGEGMLVMYLVRDGALPATGVRVVTRGPLADETTLRAYVRCDDIEDAPIDAWDTYQEVTIGMTVRLASPGHLVRVAMVRPAETPAVPFNVQINREELD